MACWFLDSERFSAPTVVPVSNSAAVRMVDFTCLFMAYRIYGTKVRISVRIGNSRTTGYDGNSSRRTPIPCHCRCRPVLRQSSPLRQKNRATRIFSPDGIAGIKNSAYLCTRIGGLAQLARALAWHARGHRFESDILHNKKPAPHAYRGDI
mgnify:FL=1